jgi:hypothetical protein
MFWVYIICIIRRSNSCDAELGVCIWSRVVRSRVCTGSCHCVTINSEVSPPLPKAVCALTGSVTFRKRICKVNFRNTNTINSVA